MDTFIDFLLGYKNVKLFYYIRTNLIHSIPKWYNDWYVKHLQKKFNTKEHQAYINNRVNYYCNLNSKNLLGENTKKIKELNRKEDASVYYFDSLEYLRFFDNNLLLEPVFGDITHSPSSPAIVKSRPVTDNNNSVVLNLDKIRHFNFIKDYNSYESKKDILIGRGILGDPKRIRILFLEKHFENPLCDTGQTNDFRDNQWKVDFVPVYKQLKYKFILCWEGNDVATNLKYVMSSNSLAVSTKPKYETWFMEGKLIGGVHYVEIKDDFSDLDEKLTYYATHIEAAEEIIKNANAYTKQFQNKKREDLISILVLEKYFRNTNQALK
ncbi:glycosyl transferase family 90 [Flavicella sp.]|uniref:glycosyl transferase family 90 n=1 Tax=Flavicella sp. TaxID=2957742 RepID=UPI002618E706|nr:glycosyl transferase family 90 [Flavicella sp.]MDG1805527.1 glycosyl transferase family 90 [Flavicella sp.]